MPNAIQLVAAGLRFWQHTVALLALDEVGVEVAARLLGLCHLARHLFRLGPQLREREEDDFHLFRWLALHDTVSTELSGQENIIRLVADTATTHKVSKMAEAPGAVARLFFEFAPRCRCRGLPQGRQVRYELSDPNLAHALRDLLDVVLQVTPHREEHGE